MCARCHAWRVLVHPACCSPHPYTPALAAPSTLTRALARCCATPTTDADRGGCPGRRAEAPPWWPPRRPPQRACRRARAAGRRRAAQPQGLAGACARVQWVRIGAPAAGTTRPDRTAVMPGCASLSGPHTHLRSGFRCLQGAPPHPMLLTANTHRTPRIARAACCAPLHTSPTLQAQMWDEACDFEGELERFRHNLSKFEAATHSECDCASVLLQLACIEAGRLHSIPSFTQCRAPCHQMHVHMTRLPCLPPPPTRVPDAFGAHPARAAASRVVSAGCMHLQQRLGVCFGGAL